MYGDRCNSCGKQFIKKNKKNTTATHPPSVRHLDHQSVEMAKKGRSEKLKIIASMFLNEGTIIFFHSSLQYLSSFSVIQ
jgi:hypothetical protein